jgi:hypothetical protein
LVGFLIVEAHSDHSSPKERGLLILYGMLAIVAYVAIPLVLRYSHPNSKQSLVGHLKSLRPRRSTPIKTFSDRDRSGAFGHRRIVDLAEARKQSRRRYLLWLGGACSIAFAAGFAWPEIVHLGGTIYTRAIGTQQDASPASITIPLCVGWVRLRRTATCIVDGDTGWERGVKWRLSNVDTPELTSPRCVREFRLALDARKLLQRLMSQGYRVSPTGRSDTYGRSLVRIALSDGRDVGDVLVAAGLARSWPYGLKRWCDR